MSFAKNIGKCIGKNISKNLSIKHGAGMLAMRIKLLDHAKKPAAYAIKTSWKRVIQKTVEATDDLIGNTIVNRITKVSKNSENVTNEHDKEIPKERYISPEERKEIIDELILK